MGELEDPKRYRDRAETREAFCSTEGVPIGLGCTNRPLKVSSSRDQQLNSYCVQQRHT